MVEEVVPVVEDVALVVKGVATVEVAFVLEEVVPVPPLM
jgi:hypothetical protein